MDIGLRMDAVRFWAFERERYFRLMSTISVAIPGWLAYSRNAAAI